MLLRYPVVKRNTRWDTENSASGRVATSPELTCHIIIHVYEILSFNFVYNTYLFHLLFNEKVRIFFECCLLIILWLKSREKYKVNILVGDLAIWWPTPYKSVHISLTIDGHSGSFQRTDSFVLVHSIEQALSAPKRLFRLPNTFFEVVPHILFIAFII